MGAMLHCDSYVLCCCCCCLSACLHVPRMNNFASTKCEEQLLGRGHIAKKDPPCKSSKVKERGHGGGGLKCTCCFVILLQATSPCKVKGEKKEIKLEIVR